MDKPICADQQAVKQAGMVLKDYLNQAKDEIDTIFGKGYAKAHPELLAQCVRAQADDYNATALTAALYEIATALERCKK